MKSQVLLNWLSFHKHRLVSYAKKKKKCISNYFFLSPGFLLFSFSRAKKRIGNAVQIFSTASSLLSVFYSIFIKNFNESQVSCLSILTCLLLTFPWYSANKSVSLYFHLPPLCLYMFIRSLHLVCFLLFSTSYLSSFVPFVRSPWFQCFSQFLPTYVISSVSKDQWSGRYYTLILSRKSECFMYR